MDDLSMLPGRSRLLGCPGAGKTKGIKTSSCLTFEKVFSVVCLSPVFRSGEVF